MSINAEFSDSVNLRIIQETLRLDYESFFISGKIEGLKLAPDDRIAFESACRWHTNSHIIEEEWLKVFEEIKYKLDTKENMAKPSDLIQEFLR